MAASSSSAPLWDPSLFLKTLHVVGIKVTQEKTSSYLKHFSSSLLKRKNLKPIQKASQTVRLLLLDPEKLPTVASVQAMDGIGKMLEEDKAEVFMQDIQLQYDSFNLEEALRMVLPQDIQEIPSSFEIIGHIAHLNLRTPCLPHKHIIGRMIIDKTPGIRTVVNKVDSIQNQYRVFPMEVIAGDENMDVEVSEGNCKFRFNFGEVYWNSRLQTEHDRIVNKILSQGKTRPAVVADMFAGVGPFSIPLAHRRATVYANDLNPSSYNYLVANAKLNKIPSNRHYSSNQDGREFMRELILKGVRPTDVIMNLPASAIEFLDVFKGLYLPEDTLLPTIHCYSFSDAEDLEAATIAEIESVLGTKLVSPFVHNVRDVAPKKFMMCTTFVLPTSIERRLVDPAERPSSPKRQRL